MGPLLIFFSGRLDAPVHPCSRTCINLLLLNLYVAQLYLGNRNRNRNRNLRTSKALLKSQAHQGTSLFTSAATNQRGVSKGGQEKLRSEFQSTRRGQSSC